MSRLRRLVWRPVLAAVRRRGPFAERVVLHEVETLKDRGLVFLLRWNVLLAWAWLRDRAGRRRYVRLDEAALSAARRSDTVFVFGTGSSLNDLAPEEWEAFARHDVVGFNAFHWQRWIPVDFYVLRGGVYGQLRWRAHAEELARSLRETSLYERTIFVVQEGFLAQHGNQLVGHGLLPEGARVARYRNLGSWGPPTRRLEDGLRSIVGTLELVVNFAVIAGWREIVLVGVDLYDGRHFFLPPDEVTAVDRATGNFVGGRVERHGLSADDPHNTARSGVVEVMREWREILAADGVELSVYNPRSLLTEVLPVHPREGVGERA